MIAVTASVSEAKGGLWKVRIFDHEPTLHWFVYNNEPPNNIGLVPAYQRIYENWSKPDVANPGIIAFSHDDWEPHEPWVTRIEAEFADPKVAIVGMGGAKGIGHEHIYKIPYAIQQLARVDYMSNQTDAEIHGRRFTGATDVAVIDGFFCAIRTSFLDEIGGFKWIMEGTRFHNWDNAICLEAWRRGYKVRMVGISCTHHGGGTSTSAEYAQSCKDWGTTIEEEHRAPHRWLYSRYVDLLPLRIK